MTKTKKTVQLHPIPAALPTEREVSSHYGVCGYCGKTPAVHHSLRGEYMCPDCLKTALLDDACYAHLKELAASVIAAWGHQWAAMGVPFDDLVAQFRGFVGGEQIDGETDVLRATLADFPVEEYVKAHPDRVLLDVGALPTLDGITFDSGTYSSERLHLHQHFSAHYPDGSAAYPLHLSPGCDTLLLLNAWGEDAVLYYTGTNGVTNPTRPEAYRVPAGMLPQVRKTLSYTAGEPQES